MKKETIITIFQQFSAQNPHPQTELHYQNHFTLLVAVVLSAQATDVSVNKATARLFQIADTPAKMLSLGEDGLREHIKTIGLYNSKAKNVMALCQSLLNEYGGEIPKKREQLEKLAGVGKKTAAVVMNVAYGESTIAVDTHVFRVANRIGLVKTTSPDTTEAALTRKIPMPWLQHAHHWLILHGRYVCKARKPDCKNCLISALCEYKAKEVA